jgi:hypothetical protein
MPEVASGMETIMKKWEKAMAENPAGIIK